MSSMRTLALTWVVSMLTVVAFGQQAQERMCPSCVSVCEIAHNPERFEGDFVTLRARYTVNWEWGAWIGQERCDRGIEVVFANGYSRPGDSSKLYLQHDSAFDAFSKKERQLCNGMSFLCEFDFLEADFTGVVVGPKHFSELIRPDATVLVVTAVSNSKLHRDEHPTH